MNYAWWTVILALIVALIHAVSVAWARLRNNPLRIDPGTVRARCGAKARPLHHEMGWTCTGKDLVVLTHAQLDSNGPKLPGVAPRWVLPIVLSKPWASTYDEPTLFTGGDHFHLTLPAARQEADR